MNPIYFLAEMSVSEKHGSGITVCRTLGKDLESIRTFFCLDDVCDQEPRFLPRTHRWRPFFTSSVSRRLLGCRLSHTLNTSHWHRRLMGRVYAGRIDKLLPASSTPLTFLVCPHYTLSMYTMQFLRRLRKVNYVTWIMDNNWVRRAPSGDWIYSPADSQILNSHFKDATKVFTISQPMGQHFKEYFGIQGEELFAPSPLDHPPQISNNGSLKKLGYFGNLHAWPVDALTRLAPLLKDSGYTLDIYSYATLPQALQTPEITLMPPLPAHEVATRMGDYSAVLLPMGYSDTTAAYSRFNIATKMSECLGSGTVTFAIGPDNAAMIRYLREHRVGLTLSELQPSTLQPILDRLSSPADRSRIIRDQSAHVASHLNLKVTARRFAQATDLLHRMNPPLASA
jgi:hypothetical protein